MKIKTSHWTYRYIKFILGQGVKPKTLCSYFWTFVACMLLLPFYGLARLGGFYIYLFSGFNNRYDWDRFYDKDEYPDINFKFIIGMAVITFVFNVFIAFCISYWMITLHVLGIIAIMVACVGLVFGIYAFFTSDTFRSLIKRSAKTPKQPNIFLEYLKARKQKVCPIIEYEEDEHK